MEHDIQQAKVSSLTYRMWLVDIYEEYCTALFYIRFEECGKQFYASITNDFDKILDLLNKVPWKIVKAKSVDPSEFDYKPIIIQNGKNGMPISDLKENRYNLQNLSKHPENGVLGMEPNWNSFEIRSIRFEKLQFD